jgi:hypothetical protein
MIMLMGSGYVSELRPLMGPLFILQIIYDHGEPWWNDIDRRKHVIRPPKLFGNPTSSHLVASSKAVRTGKGNAGFGLKKYIYFYFEGIFNTP